MSTSLTAFIVAVFIVTYVGMALGRVPGLRLDRSGIAIVCAYALLVFAPSLRGQLVAAIDVPTLLVLAALMGVSGELELAGFYELTAFRLARLSLSPRALLAVVVLAIGVLSALLTNDVVVFALTPMLVRSLSARGLDPRPYLLAAAAASNAGSAATTIGNPQNVLLAAVGHLGFARHFMTAAPIAIGSLALVWFVVARTFRAELAGGTPRLTPASPPTVRGNGVVRGLTALVAVIAALLVVDRPAIALGGIAALLLVSRVQPSRALLSRIDWPMLLLFVGLFVVTEAISSTGIPAAELDRLRATGFDPARHSSMAVLCLVGANTIGNVPLVALLLTVWRVTDPDTLSALAIFSTLAGNLLLTGSVANLIVFERAAEAGAPLDFRTHARVGVPIALSTMALAYAWLWLLRV